MMPDNVVAIPKKGRVIRRNGKPQEVVLPIRDYMALQRLIEDLKDSLEIQRAKNEIKSGKDRLLPYRKVRAVRALATACCCSFFLLGCELLDPESPRVSIPIEKLKSAPERITIEGREFTLQTYLWRDFMPISPPDGQPLVGVFYITATDTQPFPSSVRAERAFLIKEAEVWETSFSSENRIPDPRRKHQLEKIVRDGPKWGPGISVDAVVRLLDGANRSHLLRASKQLIHRTD